MDATGDYTAIGEDGERPDVRRLRVAENLWLFDQLDCWQTSTSGIARRLDVPRSTMRGWRDRRDQRLASRRWPVEIVRFFESPEGLTLLHRLLTALHLVFVQANDCGIRNLCWYLKLSGLDEFVASSYGAQQEMAREMESLLGAFGQQEDQRLAAEMPPRTITLCEDETFHPQICLVALEPVSQFILLEQYQPSRNAETWNRCLDERLAPLSVTVCQVTSDEAKALIAHTEVHLGAHHSPDLFHVQYDTVRATSAALAGQTRRAKEALEQSQQATAGLREQLEACAQQCPQSSHLPLLQQQVQQAEAAQTAVNEHVSACQDRQQRATEARQGLGRDYHPFDLQNGQPLEADQVAERLTGHFDTLEKVAAEAGLSANATDKLAKARRVLSAMQATIAFFWSTIATWLTAWNLSEPVQQWMREQLIPGFYLRRAAEKASTADERLRLRELAEKILARARSPDSIWGTLSPEEQASLEQKARDCADLFQRSSSCVEGRNGQLSLRHHALHQLSGPKLQALTVLHNYVVQRRDGSTAASRFYGQAPRDVFGWLLARHRLPPNPRARRRVA